ncbi:hypothetical protein [Brucella sp. BO2]|uniref:hypothetical protein n=1 Tax=Brucella sp. BO2 TaxID=693750 RepID=UPI000303D352|nr:hypothetical protein [Brucella sp. BO2]
MSKRLDVTARQVTAICKGAEKAGHIPEIKIGNAFIRLVPDDYVTEKDEIDERGKGYL